jgi:hypothetical protein
MPETLGKVTENYGAARYGPRGVYALPEDPVVTQRARRYALFMWMFYIVFVLWVSTEFLAWRFQDAPILGPNLIPGVYLPYQCIQWSFQFYPAHYRTLEAAQYARGAIDVAGGFLLIGTILATIRSMADYRRSLRNAPRAPDLKGSAHWASPTEIWRMGLITRKPKG